jgi:hypothetical protein
MNRSLLVPAGCCLFAFAALLAALHGVTGQQAAAELIPPDASGRRAGASNANGDLLLSIEEAEQVLTTLVGEYLRPWRQWEASPHRLYSRAAPRPIPTILAKVEVSPSEACRSDKFLVAKIDVSIDGLSQPTACVVDRLTKEVLLFADGQWLTKEEWLSKAQMP